MAIRQAATTFEPRRTTTNLHTPDPKDNYLRQFTGTGQLSRTAHADEELRKIRSQLLGMPFEDQIAEEVPRRIDSPADGDDEAYSTENGLYMRAHCTAVPINCV